jgi:hypothetical protein
MLYVVDAASGRLRDAFRPGSTIDTYAAPLVTPGTVYTAHGATLYALSIDTP